MKTKDAHVRLNVMIVAGMSIICLPSPEELKQTEKAGGGSRTRLVGLGSQNFTDKPRLHNIT